MTTVFVEIPIGRKWRRIVAVAEKTARRGIRDLETIRFVLPPETPGTIHLNSSIPDRMLTQPVGVIWRSPTAIVHPREGRLGVRRVDYDGDSFYVADGPRLFRIETETDRRYGSENVVTLTREQAKILGAFCDACDLHAPEAWAAVEKAMREDFDIADPELALEGAREALNGAGV